MTTTATLPGQKVIGVVPPAQAAELGILAAIPILQVTWFDERQTCNTVHDYLEGKIEGRLEDFNTCFNYAAGVCRGTGGAGMLCMFHEHYTAPIWQRAMQWERFVTEDGALALQRRK